MNALKELTEKLEDIQHTPNMIRHVSFYGPIDEPDYLLNN